MFPPKYSFSLVIALRRKKHQRRRRRVLFTFVSGELSSVTGSFRLVISTPTRRRESYKKNPKSDFTFVKSTFQSKKIEPRTYLFSYLFGYSSCVVYRFSNITVVTIYASLGEGTLIYSLNEVEAALGSSNYFDNIMIHADPTATVQGGLTISYEGGKARKSRKVRNSSKDKVLARAMDTRVGTSHSCS
ncbi:hypothetical protein Bca101_020345 [Brassica carinata]